MDIISPIVMIFQLTASQFQAGRFSNTTVEKIHLRNIQVIYQAIHTASNQPLSRELQFRLVIAISRVNQAAISLDDEQKWLLKDAALSLGLKWFAQQPM